MSRGKVDDTQLGIFAPTVIERTGVPVRGVCQICGYAVRDVVVNGEVRGHAEWHSDGVPCAVMGGPCAADRILSRVRFTVIRHRVRAGRSPSRCGSACLGARGNTCDCECGGHNHGAAQ